MTVPGAVQLRLFDLNAPLSAAASATLSAEELARAARFHFERDRRHFIAGRAALRGAIAAASGLAPERVEIVTDEPRGKPRGGNTPPGLRFNFSHSGGWGLLALDLAGREVGVDLEAEREVREFEAISARHFTAREHAEVLAGGDATARQAAFYRLWTRKEAYLKLTGLGLPGGLRTVEVGSDPAPRALVVPADHRLPRAWVTSLALPARLPSGFFAALAAVDPLEFAWGE